MNKVDEAWQVLKNLPVAEQERMAEAILDFAAQQSGLRLSDEQLADLERRMSEKNPKTLTIEEVRARVRNFGK